MYRTVKNCLNKISWEIEPLLPCGLLFLPHFGQTKIFPNNTPTSVFSIYNCLIPCKKLKKFIVPFLSKLEIYLFWAPKCPILAHFGQIRLFSKNRASSILSNYNFIPSCQISQIFILWLLRKVRYRRFEAILGYFGPT